MIGRKLPKTIGVIGGMGPAATLDFHAKILAATPAESDQDHIRLIIDSNPFLPDRNRALALTGPSPGPWMADMALNLQRCGCAAIAITCNTAHVWADDVEEAVKIPLINMVAATVEEAAALAPKAVGVLAGEGCRRSNIYQRGFDRKGVPVIWPSDISQKRLMQAIYRIKAGDTGAQMRATMRDFAQELVDAGADAVVAACTEAPLVLSAADLDVPFVSSTDVLVARTIAFARAELNT